MGLKLKDRLQATKVAMPLALFVKAVARTLNRAIFFEDAGRERQFGTRRRVKPVKS